MPIGNHRVLGALLVLGSVNWQLHATTKKHLTDLIASNQFPSWKSSTSQAPWKLKHRKTPFETCIPRTNQTQGEQNGSVELHKSTYIFLHILALHHEGHVASCKYPRISNQKNLSKWSDFSSEMIGDCKVEHHIDIAIS